MNQSKKIKPQTLKGFRDFLPEEALKRQYLQDKIRQVFELYGFDPLETPALEYLETFTGQIGEDEKLFYRFSDQGDRQVALRYDQTVPASRVIAQYPQINLPFKRYQIQLAWRAEKPQKGRYREFLQCDADIFGIAGPEADAQVIALSMEIYRLLGFRQIKTLINDRSLFGPIPYSVISAIDKLKKIGKDAVVKEIIRKGFSAKEAEEYLNRVSGFKPSGTLNQIFAYLKSAGFPQSWYQFEPTLARSFSYSTGPIWEIEIPGFSGGSVLGGERYDKLVGKFTKTDIPATGFGLGFDRTLEAMEEFKLIPSLRTKTLILVTVFSRDLLPDSLNLAGQLRTAGFNTDLYPDAEIKLDKQLKYADKKGIPLAIILGPDEVKNNCFMIKNLASGKQDQIEQKNLIDYLKITNPQ